MNKSVRLQNVRYDIRGPVLAEAKRLEGEGRKIIKLNIGNPAPFGFDVSDEVREQLIANIGSAQGYSDSKGILPAREAVVEYCGKKGIPVVSAEDVYMGNGASELIQMTLQGFLDPGDEILVPAPDYPLWTAAVTLAGGKAVHYLCDEAAGWFPDLADMKRKIGTRTKGIVVINPNNPTGSVYPLDVLKEIVELARKNRLALFSDEIYDQILYDDAAHTSLAAIAPDLLVHTFNGMSKAYRAAGFRAGWLVLTGCGPDTADYRQGLDTLSSLRLCSNVLAQVTIPAALRKDTSIRELVAPGGRLCEQRNTCQELLEAIPGISCVKPRGALYSFPKIDVKRFAITSDEKFALDFLREKQVLVVHGTGFNWHAPDHFRVVFLADTELLRTALGRLGEFLSVYRQRTG